MKITMYELLEMVKDGKAPKKVKYGEFIYSYVEGNRLFAKYIREPFNAKIPYYLFTDIANMNEEVEILEEEKKIPEKLPKSVTDNACSSKDMRLIALTLNEIIDYLKSKGE